MDKTLLKGLTLVELLAHSEESRGVTSLARELQLSKSNVHRILLTLQSKQYVRRVDSNSTYELTPKIWELGSLVRGRLSLLKVSNEYMMELARATGESVHLSILEGGEVVYIDKIESSQPIAAYTRIGGRAPAYCVATGKAMLATVPGEELDSLLPKLKRFTDSTITAHDKLRSELIKTREAGYAVNRGEWREDVFGVASPIWDGAGRALGAIGISGPSVRYKAKQVKVFSGHVVKAAQKIAGALGHNSRYPSPVGPR
ncbi:IclR family transcriptional regulator [Bradyrhizobium sp. JYMT SZCCT0428]|uniref:IclR family transcriptional regulator n=1 Tax=Bradyrhizobium sp. JYMT SZCCT0428 TaxID=2807673 RepID=UPI001BA7E158|nr:IclR family transcriptional regulator [Bradyrhizobium sp. JYMT SZCCT0428]MBR1149432.1 IclR family transcriptional regulator [Bradyrhizobium sp. JYMT SZCCT0428]